MQKWFALLVSLGKDPTSLARWEYEFFEPDADKLRVFCGRLDADGYAFRGLRKDGGSISTHPGWVLKVDEVTTHSPATMLTTINKLEALANESSIELLCGYAMHSAPKRDRVKKAWEPLWESAVAKLEAKQAAASAAFVTKELDEFFARATGSAGAFTSWLPFLQMHVKGSGLFLTDMRPGPTDDGLKVALEAGDYRVEVQGFVRGSDRRCARLRAYLESTEPELGQQLGTVSTDLATMGFYDPKCFQSLRKQGSQEFFEWGESAFDSSKSSHGVLVHDLTRSAILPYVSSGFGDGTYPVYELIQRNRRVGFEVEFIAESAAKGRGLKQKNDYDKIN
jgi:hypothetical protein